MVIIVCILLIGAPSMITYITRGRSQQRAAASVPAELVERYEAALYLSSGIRIRGGSGSATTGSSSQ